MFIVLYGINNLGKSTQAKLLAERIKKEGHKAEYVKYPCYDIKPSGTIINDYLRNGNPLNLSPREFQIINALNRTQYQNEIKEKIKNGIHIIGEDYVGSGMAWGLAWGVAETFLKQINSHLIPEDLAFIFDGQRFVESTENGHINETNKKMLQKARDAYLYLAEQYNWHKINANLTITEIHEQIWRIVKREL